MSSFSGEHYKTLAGLTAMLLLLGGCSSKATQPAKQPETPSRSEIETMLLQPATVTEVFHLRSECVALGKTIEENENKNLENKNLDLAVKKNGYGYVESTKTNYSVSANRCYVLIVQIWLTAESTLREESTVLYDGQTEEVLAAAIKCSDCSANRGYIEDHFPKKVDYSKALDYINRLMDDGEPKQ